MDSKVAAVAGAPDPSLKQYQASVPAASQKGDDAPGAGAPDPVQLRLVIEVDQASGSYVYKTIDRRTGEVVSQLPREEVLRLKDDLRYAAGTVVSTEA